MERQRHQRVISLPPPPDPPYDVESLEPLDVPPVWLWAGDCQQRQRSRHSRRVTRRAEAQRRINGTSTGHLVGAWFSGPPKPRQAEMELDLGDGRLLVFDGDPMPEDELPLFSAN